MIHSFFRSIGFAKLKKNEDLYHILEEVVNHPDDQALIEDEYGNEFVCFSKNMGPDYGISVCGNFFQDNQFRMEYYYPFFRGSAVSTCEPVEVEQHAGKQAFAGICDEMRLGVTLIFYIENVIDVLKENRYGKNRFHVENVVLSGLGFSGKILLPVQKTKEQIATKKKSSEKRWNLIQQAREGDRNAMESLTINDMDIYSSVTRRIMKEDILSIVESSIIPYGIESDQYVVLGEILSCYKEKNLVSGEEIWILSIVCNDIKLDVCINAEDLWGEPQVGRRFKGRIWMQGYLNFGY